MTDENKLIRDAGKAIRAKQLLEDEMLVEAFKLLEDSYTTAWRNTFVADTAAREKLFLAVNIVGKVREHLTLAVTNGKLAQAELTEIAMTAERRKKYGVF